MIHQVELPNKRMLSRKLQVVVDLFCTPLQDGCWGAPFEQYQELPM
jgi:hypothetical protein